MEQARVEAIGARRMAGVAQNLEAALRDRYERAGYAEIRQRADAPIEDALALLAREILTGAPPPAGGSASGRSLARDDRIRAPAPICAARGRFEDQKAFANCLARFFPTLDMAEQGDADDRRGRRRRRRPAECGPGGRNRRRREDEIRAGAENRARRGGDGRNPRRRDGVRGRPARRRSGRTRSGRGRGGGGRAPSGKQFRAPCRHRISGLRAAVRRNRRGRGSLRPRGARAPARLSRQAAAKSLRGRRAAGEPAAAPVDGAAEPRLGIRSRRGHAGPGAALAGGRRSAIAAVVQTRKGYRISATPS